VVKTVSLKCDRKTPSNVSISPLGSGLDISGFDIESYAQQSAHNLNARNRVTTPVSKSAKSRDGLPVLI
jgi:hypothetical protein